jgi:phospholipase/carboxylesterase/glyoxalase family protein
MDQFASINQGPVLSMGEPLGQARAAMVMIHGRGATAEDILELAVELNRPGFAYLAPQAANNSWYPQSFLAPISSNEPWLSSALARLSTVLQRVEEGGIPRERTILLGFSQGACLVLEFAARHARRYGGIAALSGGLIGPDGTPRDYPGSFAGTPVFLGCSDRDPHVPKERVQQSAEVLRRLGADVTMRLYPNMGHTVNQDEIEFVGGMMAALIPSQ